MYQYAEKKHTAIQRHVCQLGRGTELMRADANVYVIKVNFAGSGNLTWNKSRNPDGKGRKAFEEADRDNPFLDAHDLEELFGGADALSETEKFDAMYGRKVAGHSEMFRKEKGLSGEAASRETVFSIAGPQKFGGGLDRGDNSIEKNVESALSVITNEINNIRSHRTTPSRFCIIIKGHSRGGVAAGFTALSLRKIYKHNPLVRISVTMYDPVPGPGHKSRFDSLSLKTDYPLDSYGPAMGALEPQDDSTVIYSLCDQHYVADALAGGFTPQEITGADRTIFTTHNHTCGLDKQSASGHKQGFQIRGRELLGSDISSLGSGIYIADELGRLTVLGRMNWEQTIRPHMGSIVHRGRNEVLKRVISSHSGY